MKRRIIEHYGYEHQLGKLIEELRELQDAIIYTTQDEEHIKEEMADVLNVIDQIVEYKGWAADIYCIKQFKIDRQIKRIESEVGSEGRV